MPPALKRHDFYGESVILEYEADLGYLGMVIVPVNGSFELALSVPGTARLSNKTQSCKTTDGATARANQLEVEAVYWQDLPADSTTPPDCATQRGEHKWR